MDWQATELNSAWRGAFQGLVRKDGAYADPSVIAASARDWNDKMKILENTLSTGGSFIAGDQFTLADILIGLSINCWFHTPIERPALSAVTAYFDRLKERPSFRRGGYNAGP